MNKKFSLYVAPLFLLVAFIFSGCKNGSQDLSQVKPAQDDSPIIFFYGQGCPHCEKVEEYFKENKVKEKVKFSQREIYGDKANAALFVEKSKECGVTDESKMGVPLLWVKDEGCYTGDESVIDFFQNKIDGK